MKKPIAQVLVKSKFFIALLFLCIVFANKCWAQVVPPPTKAGCFGSGGAFKPCGSRWTDSYNGVPYNCFCDCSSNSTQDCVPVSGPTHANSGQGSIPYQTNPGDISMYGPMNGNPFFSSHPSMSFEEWASEYKQLLASYGITSILGKNFTVPRTPLTDDKYFNAAYTNLVISFEPKTKPVSNSNAPSQDASEVDLQGKKGWVVPVDYSNYNKKLESLYAVILKSQVPPLPDALREIDNTVDDRIEKTRGILVDVVGLLPPGLNYATIAVVDGLSPLASVIYNCAIRTPPNCPPDLGEEAAKKAVVNFMVDFGSAVAGDLGGKYLGKFKGFNKINIGADAEKVGVGYIEDITHYKTMPANELWNMVTKQKKDMKNDVIPAIVGVTANKVLDFFTTPKNDW